MESSLQCISSKFCVVETKRFVGSSISVILTRQTCGQRASRAAESKRRALENCFPEWICYEVLRWCIHHHSSVEKSVGLNNWVVRRSPVQFPPKPHQLKSIWTWIYRPWSKGSKLLYPVIKANKIQPKKSNMFLMSKHRGDWDLSRYTYWVLDPLRTHNMC